MKNYNDYEKELSLRRNEMFLMWLLSDMKDEYLRKKFDELNERCCDYGFKFYDVNKKGFVDENGCLRWF